VHGPLGVGRAQVGQHALADHQIKRGCGLVIHHRAALPAEAAAQILAVLHTVELCMRVVALDDIAPQPDAAADIQNPAHRHPNELQVAAHESTEAIDMFGVCHAGFLIEVVALVIRLVKQVFIGRLHAVPLGAPDEPGRG